MADPSLVPAESSVVMRFPLNDVMNLAVPNAPKYHMWKPVAMLYLSTRRSSDYGSCFLSSAVTILLHVSPSQLDIFIESVHLKSAVLIICDEYEGVRVPHRTLLSTTHKTLRSFKGLQDFLPRRQRITVFFKIVFFHNCTELQQGMNN